MMAISPLAPFATLKLLKASEARSHVGGIDVALMATTVITVRLTTAILRALAPIGILVPPLLVAAYVVQTALVPLATGIAVQACLPGFADRLAPLARKGAVAVVGAIALLIFIRFARDIVPLIGGGTLAAVAAIVAAGFGSA